MALADKQTADMSSMERNALEQQLDAAHAEIRRLRKVDTVSTVGQGVLGTAVNQSERILNNPEQISNSVNAFAKRNPLRKKHFFQQKNTSLSLGRLSIVSSDAIDGVDAPTSPKDVPLTKLKETRRESPRQSLPKVNDKIPVEDGTFEVSQNQACLEKLRHSRKPTRSGSDGSFGSANESKSDAGTPNE